MKTNKVLDQEDIFHIYDHDEQESLQIIGKSEFISWLNVHAFVDRYSFFSTYEKLQAYLSEE
jgi:hypothetical protein